MAVEVCVKAAAGAPDLLGDCMYPFHIITVCVCVFVYNYVILEFRVDGGLIFGTVRSIYPKGTSYFRRKRSSL